MANAVIGPSDNSAYPLFLAYALVVVSLWKVDMGIVGQPFLTQSGGNNIGATSLAASKVDHSSRPQLHRLRAPSDEHFAVDPSARARTEADNEEVRLIATLALMVYATGDGIKR